MFRHSLSRIPLVVNHCSKRRLYTVPEIELLQKDQGIKGLYSKEGLAKAWFDRSEYYTKKLNEETSENSIVLNLDHIVEEFYKEPTKKNLFENASLLSSLKFSFESLDHVNELKYPNKINLPNKSVLNESLLLKTPLLQTSESLINSPSNENLEKWIIDSFGSLVEFKTLLINSAKSIKGDGFTWLVVEKLNRRTVKYENMYVLNSYGSGQPNSNVSNYLSQLKYFNEREKELANEKNSKDLDGNASPIIEDTDKSNDSLAFRSMKYSYESTLFSSLSEASDRFFEQERSFVPVLAIDASPKAYLHDYGVFGKETYLENVWNCINWERVASRLPNRDI